MYTLFDYQVPIVDKIRLALERTGRALVDMATGTGKTVVGAYVVKDLVKQGRGLLLCHNTQILEQDLELFQEILGPSVTLGVFHGHEKEWNEVDILFATFQTMDNWKQAFHTNEFLYIIVDESHHAQAETFKPVIEYFTPNYRLALTATPDRMDGKDIREMFGEEVVKLTLEEAIGNGYLADVEYRLLSDNLDNEALKKLAHEVLKEGKRIPLSKINETIFIEARDEKVAETILGYGKKKVIVFCESIAHADNFKDFLPESKVYHSGKSDDTNDRTLKAFRKGGFDRLIAVDSFNEGMDIPEVEMIVFLRCTDSKRIFLQQLGRGLRKTREKKVVIVLDFVANIERMMVIRDMAEQIRIISANTLTQGAKPRQEKLHIKGNSYDFVFSDEEINILEILEKLQPRYVSDVPELLREYSTRNILPASQVRAGTSKKLWWKCSKPECGYEWQAAGSDRVKGSGCSFCLNRVVNETNNLTITHPELAKEYSTKNPKPANEVFAGTGKKLWWKCSKPECGHEWQAVGNNRVHGNGCPLCSNQVVTEKNNLAVTYPELAKEYSTKNPKPANEVVAGTNKKLWWKCSKPECGYEWQAPGNRRAQGCGCPSCSGHKVTEKNNLAVTYPELAKEYSTKNPKPANEVVAGTNKKLWWKCSKPECGCEWQAAGSDRVKGVGCPGCSGHKVTEKNNLAVTHPELAKEYSTKNLLPANEVVAGTSKKLWWKCSKPECGCEWQASGSMRVNQGSGCPKWRTHKK